MHVKHVEFECRHPADCVPDLIEPEVVPGAIDHYASVSPYRAVVDHKRMPCSERRTLMSRAMASVYERTIRNVQ